MTRGTSRMLMSPARAVPKILQMTIMTILPGPALMILILCRCRTTASQAVMDRQKNTPIRQKTLITKVMKTGSKIRNILMMNLWMIIPDTPTASLRRKIPDTPTMSLRKRIPDTRMMTGLTMADRMTREMNLRHLAST